jgi:hypothetical protein
MNNRSTLIVVLAIILCVGLGCSSINPFSDKGKSGSSSNKTLTDKGIDTIVGGETTGIPECDEVMDMIAAEANNPDDGYIVKATKGLFLNKIKESIKKSVEENKNKNGTADLAKTCGDFKKELDKYKAEQDAKGGN